ncbi:MAG: hypothetical protein QGG67_15350 [Gammaproteobacteria bacterium]|jgi:hypothetical protein|nr:hypothetical protein [Gammaproteobacteria bacterium]MDP6097339.1 hypothetical protein [Gammaproteobacteria bacterium]|tara:strand:+ start:952 stop:1644 length:693 start_codon:yes stop_codon:yes gene_type:complete
MNKSTWFALTTGCGLFLVSLLALGHAGSVDLNGGHYFLNSYHCHMATCEMPDLDRFGRRDGLFTNRREREKFFNEDDWSYEEDADGDCQSTRQEMLILTSRIEVSYTNPRNCVVRIGEWLDEYTGKLFKVATQIDLDHVIPLMYAHTHGGDLWTQGKKLQFANDPINLVLIEKREIRRKGDRGPDQYLPREEYKCSYVRLWNAIAEKYDIDIESRDRIEIARTLRDCPEQ